MDALYLDYATGALSEPARLLVDTHFTLRPETRRHARLWELAGVTLFDAEIEGMAESALDRTLARIGGTSATRLPPSEDELPGPLGETVGLPLGALAWHKPAPGALEYVMPRWPQARLIRVTEAVAPEWTLGPELSLLLRGDIEVDGVVGQRGDVIMIDRSVAPPTPLSEDCLYFSVQTSGYSARDVAETLDRVGDGDWRWRPA